MKRQTSLQLYKNTEIQEFDDIYQIRLYSEYTIQIDYYYRCMGFYFCELLVDYYCMDDCFCQLSFMDKKWQNNNINQLRK